MGLSLYAQRCLVNPCDRPRRPGPERHGRLDAQIVRHRPDALSLHLPLLRVVPHRHRHLPPRDHSEGEQDPLPRPRCRHRREGPHALGPPRREEEAAGASPHGAGCWCSLARLETFGGDACALILAAPRIWTRSRSGTSTARSRSSWAPAHSRRRRPARWAPPPATRRRRPVPPPPGPPLKPPRRRNWGKKAPHLPRHRRPRSRRKPRHRPRPGPPMPRRRSR